MSRVFFFRTRSGREMVLVRSSAIRSVAAATRTWGLGALAEEPFGRAALRDAQEDPWATSAEVVTVDVGSDGPRGHPIYRSRDVIIDWDSLPMLADLARRDDDDDDRGQRVDRPDAGPVVPPTSTPSESTALSGEALRVELGALGFTFGGVITLPRGDADGGSHPWAAICAAVRHARQAAVAELVVLGHAGADEPSEHAERRCASLLHLLRGERAAWVTIASKWGRVEDVQAFLAYLCASRGWPIVAPPVSGVADAATAAAVAQFQQHMNRERESSPRLAEDGVIGEQTLGACFDVAADDLVLWLEVNGLSRADLAAVFGVCVVLACERGAAHHPHAPPGALQHGGRLVDVVLVPVQDEPPDVHASPAGAGVYGVRTMGVVEPLVEEARQCRHICAAAGFPHSQHVGAVGVVPGKDGQPPRGDAVVAAPGGAPPEVPVNVLPLSVAAQRCASLAACFIVLSACEPEPDPAVLEFFEDIEVLRHDSSGRAGVEIYARVFSECAWEHDQAFRIETRGPELRPGVPHEAGRGGLTAVADWRCSYSSRTKRQDLMIECEDQRDRRWVTSFEMVREFRYCFDGESSPLAYAANPRFPPFEDPAPRASYAWETATPRLPLVYDRFGDPDAEIIERAYPVDAWDGEWEVVLIDTRPSLYLGRNVVERRMTQRWSPVLPMWTSAVLEITFAPGENPFVGSGDVATFRSNASDWKCSGCERSSASREERPW